MNTGAISVWAPDAKRLTVVGENVDIPMQRDDHGWWHATDASFKQGFDYKLRVDDKGPFPDPRSMWQPNGIHGPSRIYNQEEFEWQTNEFAPAPLKAAIIYELHIGTFSSEGTFDGAIQHLDHLKRLGVTHMELLPACEFSGRKGWGYDGVYPNAAHGAFGGPDGLKRLIDAAHGRGIAVIIDVVYNHLGPSGNYLSQFGPYFTDRHRTPWGEAVNFDGPHSDEVRRYFIENALMWLRDFRADGLRLDAVHAIHDESATHFLEQLSQEVAAFNMLHDKSAVLIAESDLNDPRMIRPREDFGFGFDAQWADEFHHALHSVVAHDTSGYYEDFGTIGHLAAALKSPFIYHGGYSRHRKRTFGKPSTGIQDSSFIVCIQNHDQVGNRARGERIGHLVSQREAMIAAALVILSPYVPMLFAGEEWNASSPFQYFTAHEEEDLANAVREGRISEFAAFGWKRDDIPDPQDEATYSRSKLIWNEVANEPHATMLGWYRALIALRKNHRDVTDCSRENTCVTFDESGRWIILQRNQTLIVSNLSDTSKKIDLPAEPACILLTSDEEVRISGACAVMPPTSIAVLSARKDLRDDAPR